MLHGSGEPSCGASPAVLPSLPGISGSPPLAARSPAPTHPQQTNNKKRARIKRFSSSHSGPARPTASPPPPHLSGLQSRFNKDRLTGGYGCLYDRSSNYKTGVGAGRGGAVVEHGMGRGGDRALLLPSRLARQPELTQSSHFNIFVHISNATGQQNSTKLQSSSCGSLCLVRI